MARGDAPRDSYHLVGISFFILGLGTLLPWNFFITAIPYFQARLAGAGNSTARILSTNHTGPEDAFNFNNWVTLLSQLPLLLFTLLNSFLYQCAGQGGHEPRTLLLHHHGLRLLHQLLQCSPTGQPLRAAGHHALHLQHPLPQRPGPGWDLCCPCHAPVHGQWRGRRDLCPGVLYHALCGHPHVHRVLPEPASPEVCPLLPGQ
ncbi:solute carrier family 29 member 2 [Homo sapiens]|uniref:Isoform 2 of Equilibrative nucleoside transporter 2 n=1 Tax=Homo sapiens TaxID=9606 RepID=Q14542-2|nr:solute carrier family 29 member 2 [Homo sapiens]KAI4072475.1 solute carrier family 29 member 2 [Homo sapiens]